MNQKPQGIQSSEFVFERIEYYLIVNGRFARQHVLLCHPIAHI
jgi:hypothetical protein